MSCRHAPSSAFRAETQIANAEKLGFDSVPICIATTENSLSHDPKVLGRPRDFDITVRGIEINARGGFVVVLTGEMLRMPGRPRKPRVDELGPSSTQRTAGCRLVDFTVRPGQGVVLCSSGRTNPVGVDAVETDQVFRLGDMDEDTGQELEWVDESLVVEV